MQTVEVIRIYSATPCALRPQWVMLFSYILWGKWLWHCWPLRDKLGPWALASSYERSLRTCQETYEQWGGGEQPHHTLSGQCEKQEMMKTYCMCIIWESLRARTQYSSLPKCLFKSCWHLPSYSKQTSEMWQKLDINWIYCCGCCLQWFRTRLHHTGS